MVRCLLEDLWLVQVVLPALQTQAQGELLERLLVQEALVKVEVFSQVVGLRVLVGAWLLAGLQVLVAFQAQVVRAQVPVGALQFLIALDPSAIKLATP